MLVVFEWNTPLQTNLDNMISGSVAYYVLQLLFCCMDSSALEMRSMACLRMLEHWCKSHVFLVCVVEFIQDRKYSGLDLRWHWYWCCHNKGHEAVEQCGSRHSRTGIPAGSTAPKVMWTGRKGHIEWGFQRFVVRHCSSIKKGKAK